MKSHKDSDDPNSAPDKQPSEVKMNYYSSLRLTAEMDDLPLGCSHPKVSPRYICYTECWYVSYHCHLHWNC